MFDLAAATNKIAELERTVVTGPGITRGIQNSYDYGEDPVTAKELFDDGVPAIVHKANGPTEIIRATQTILQFVFTIESRALFTKNIPNAPDMIQEHTGLEYQLWEPLVALFVDRANIFDLCTVSNSVSYQLDLPDQSFLRMNWPVADNNDYWGFRYLHKFTVQNQCP